MEYLSSLFCQATRLAAQAHDGAFCMGTHLPYLFHAMETAQIVATMTEDEDILAAAVLHDVLSCAGVSEEEMRETVGGHVTSLVLTVGQMHKAEPGDMDHIQRQKQVDALLSERRVEVRKIVLGDTLSEVRLLQRRYQCLGEQVWEQYHCEREALGWYYQAVTDALQDLNTYPVWHELANTVWEVFWQERDNDQLQFDLSPREAREFALF